MTWLATLLFPGSDHFQARRKLNVLVGAVVAGLLTAALVGLGFYFSNGRAFHNGY